jgi:FAD-linked sulfhydryl oxidase
VPCRNSADPPGVSTRAELSQWMCRTHNNVSARLGKPAFNCVRADARWGMTGCRDDACG